MHDADNLFVAGTDIGTRRHIDPDHFGGRLARRDQGGEDGQKHSSTGSPHAAQYSRSGCIAARDERSCPVPMETVPGSVPDHRAEGPDLIALAQKLARDAERHALLSASLASQAERLMIAGLRQLERRAAAASRPRT
ncbi:MAG TPA: hypothetical protein VFV33_22620 [Gemmatimonadaceae bacterium]|nr:hypothetical protein [Gemmatimonadaceae bacterium]